MSSKHEVSHKGITIKINKRTTHSNGKAYINWEIREHTPKGLVRHKRASLQEAREKAKEICEAKAAGKQEVIGWDRNVWGEVLRALEILPASCLCIDRAAQIVIDAMRYVDADLIVEACRCFKRDNPGPITAKPAKEVTSSFRERQCRRLSIRRVRTESTYLNAFDEAFADRVFATITAGELLKMVDDTCWSKATRNDALNTFSTMFEWAMGQGWGFTNPASSSVLKRDRLGGSDIDYFTPDRLRLIFNSVEDDLKPFIALWAFRAFPLIM